MKSNIGMLDRYVRLASGVVMLGCAMSMRRRSFLARSALMGFGAMKVSEGVTGWCPLVHLGETLAGNANNQQASGQQKQSVGMSQGSQQPQHEQTNGRTAMDQSRQGGAEHASESTFRSEERKHESSQHGNPRQGASDSKWSDSQSNHAHHHSARSSHTHPIH